MRYQAVVLNGTSSSGKSVIARALQAQFPEPWLTFGIDHLIAAMPAAMMDAVAGIGFGEDGAVTVGESFARLNVAWEQGIAMMARAGAPVIIDDALPGGGAGQERWRLALGDLPTLWVGVHCAPSELVRRERARSDRIVGMAATQLPLVHAGVTYDLEVDTTDTPAAVCADLIATRSRPDP